MDYITAELEKAIEIGELTNNLSHSSTLLQSYIEYLLFKRLAILWYSNFDKCDTEDKLNAVEKLKKPTVGTIINLISIVDVNGEFKKSKSDYFKYLEYRNEFIGHGYVLKDKYLEHVSSLKDILNQMQESMSILEKKYSNLIYTLSFSNDDVIGIWYSPSGGDQVWKNRATISDGFTFEIGHLYCTEDFLSFVDLSPFVVSDSGKNFYTFCSLMEPSTGKVSYNKLVSSGKKYFEWKNYFSSIEFDGQKEVSANGTVKNIYERNYDKYIEMGTSYKSIIDRFLIHDKASVAATLWGHGGSGKTATVQSVCDDLFHGSKKVFDYIIFLSAKNRTYNYLSGQIEGHNQQVASFGDLAKNINRIIFNNDNLSLNEFYSFTCKTLLVIDDFETFSKDDVDLVEEMISNLNINYHKLLITTRVSRLAIGKEIKTNELNNALSIQFLNNILIMLGFPDSKLKYIESNDGIKEKIYNITSGRPLFIYQLAFLIRQIGVDSALQSNISESQNAVDFLYGRIYEYLSDTGKKIFCCIGFVVEKNDLRNLVPKLMYVLNLESLPDDFNAGIKELEKLKVIKLDEDEKYFEVYSIEIFALMVSYFERSSQGFKGTVKARYNQINLDKNLDIDNSLLSTANSNRLSKSEIEVKDSYRQILNRATSALAVKLNAVLNLAAYLVDRGKRQDALSILDEYSHLFSSQVKNDNLSAQFIKMRATYYWANGTYDDKKKSIDILLEYVSRYASYATDLNLEIHGMLLQYRSIQVVNNLFELKGKYNRGLIAYQEYKIKRVAYIRECHDIHNKHGIFFYNEIVKRDISKMSGGAKQNTLNGLFSFCDVLKWTNRIELALKICDFVLNCAPKHFHSSFQSKRKQFISYSKNT